MVYGQTESLWQAHTNVVSHKGHIPLALRQEPMAVTLRVSTPEPHVAHPGKRRLYYLYQRSTA